MGQWREMQLGDFLELKRGYDLPKKNRSRGDVPLVSSSGLSDTHSEAKVSGPGVVTGRYGTIGQVFYVENDFWPLNTTLYVKDFKGNDPLFTYYFLQTVNYSEYSDKAAVPGVNRNHLHSAKIFVPTDVDEQRDIAGRLWLLDQKIELNRQINQTLEQIAQAIFKSWFVDFDPVKAKANVRAHSEQSGQSIDPDTLEAEMNRAAMRAISGKTDKELDQLLEDDAQGGASVAGGTTPGATYQQLATTAALFPSEFEESELGEIPKGWRYKSAKDIANVAIGKTPPRKEPQWFSDNPSDIRWISIKDMGNAGMFAHKTSEYLTEDAVGKFNVKRIPSHTVILSFKLTVGRVSITDGEMLSNEAIAHFNLDKDEKRQVTTEYLYLYLKDFDFSNLGSTSSIATAVNSKTIKEMPILAPSNKILIHFTKIVSGLFEAIKGNQSETMSLEQLRDSLLPQLLSGELGAGNGE